MLQLLTVQATLAFDPPRSLEDVRGMLLGAIEDADLALIDTVQFFDVAELVGPNERSTDA
jgi:hypothetical protein